jgi:hypothetical protein
MSLFSTTAPDFNDTKKTLLAKIAEAIAGINSSNVRRPSKIRITDFQILGTSAIKILEANPNRTRAILQNDSGMNGFNVGNADVQVTAFTGGFPIGTAPVGTPVIENRLELFTTGEVWAIGASRVTILEEISE